MFKSIHVKCNANVFRIFKQKKTRKNQILTFAEHQHHQPMMQMHSHIICADTDTLLGKYMDRHARFRKIFSLTLQPPIKILRFRMLELEEKVSLFNI